MTSAPVRIVELITNAENAEHAINGKMISDIGDYDAKRAVVKLKAAVQNLTHALRTRRIDNDQ